MALSGPTLHSSKHFPSKFYSASALCSYKDRSKETKYSTCQALRKQLLIIKLGLITEHISLIFISSSSSSSFEGHPLQVRHKQDWGRGFILLLPQTAVLPKSDAGSGVIKPASSFVIQNRQTSCSMWCPMYWARC